MDDIVYTKFISSISECMETFCSRYLPFNQQVLLTGQLFLSVDFHERRDYVINEKLFVSPERQIVHACSSYINTTQQNHKIETAPRGYDANYAYTGAAYVATETASERALPSTENRWSGNANTTFPTVAETNKYSEKRQDHVNLPPNTSVAAVADTIQLGSSISNLECLKNACSLALANEDTGAERANIPSSSNIASVSKAADKIKYVGKIRTLNFNTDNLNVAIEKCKEEERKAAVDLLLDADSFDEESQVSDPSWKPKGAKRKRVVLTLAAKKEICEEKAKNALLSLHDLVKFAQAKFNVRVGTSTIGDILRTKDKLMSLADDVKQDPCSKQFKSKRRRGNLYNPNKPIRERDPSNPNKLYKCYYCDKRFIYRQLMRHEKYTHGELKYRCRFCDRVFNNPHYGRIHERNTHIRDKEEWKFKCDECGKKFLFGHFLKTHKKNVHGVKRFTCETCGKVFPTSYNLMKHYETHIQDRPHKCAKCGKGFKSINHVKRHDLVVHIGRAPVPCDLCGKSLSTKWQVKKHQKKSCPKSVHNNPGHNPVPGPMNNNEILHTFLINH